jgi:hypothetical protein
MGNLGEIAFIVLLVGSVVGYIVLWVMTYQDIQRSDLDSSSKGMWTLAILVFQFFGPLAWWMAGPGTRDHA